MKAIKKYDLNLLGFVSGILTAMITLASFLVVKPPVTGPFCRENCLEYPFSGIESQFPKDYIWMYFMVILMFVYVIFSTAIYSQSGKKRKIFGRIGLSFSVMAATILLIDYFLQISVIQPSVLKGEFNGIPLLTQYNPHGIFIALEETGYLLMTVSFLFFAFIFKFKTTLEKIIRIVFISGFALSICSLVIVSVIYNIHREYILECIVIVVSWLVLIINGSLISRVFWNRMNTA
jgi:hypothetical protein